MKLRIKGNSLRVRVQKQELLMLEKEGSITDEIWFGISPENKLSFKLESVENLTSLEINFSSQCISIGISRNVVLEMANTNRVGIAGTKAMDGKETLSILVEKDFKCLTPREEDYDAFPHPDQTTGHAC